MKFFQSKFALIVALAPISAASCTAAPAPALTSQSAEREITFPVSAAVLNVRDFGAKGDGKTDDTKAIQAAMTEALRRSQIADASESKLREALFYGKELGALANERHQINQTVYLPRGTYLVSDTLSYGADPERARKMQFVGQGRANTVLRLRDNATGFGNSKKPAAVLSFFEGEKQQNWGDGTNIAMNNVCENLTIDVGTGNVGAIGLDYINNNAGYIRDVTIRSSDPQRRGAIGLKLTRQLGGIGLISNLRVEGFDIGIATGSWKIAYTFEHIELANQREVGLKNTDKPLQIRDLRSDNSVPAIVSDGESAQIVLLDSQLRGGDAANFAIELRGGALLARNVSSQGYKSALRDHGKAVAGARIEEIVSPAANTLGKGTPAKTLGLKIEETPAVPFDAPDKWAVVDSTKQADDTAAIQAAIDSGATTVFLPGDFYQVDGTIVVRGTVRRLDLGRSSFYRSKRGIALPLFTIETGEAPVTQIEGVDSHLVGSDFIPLFFLNRSNKTVVLRDLYFGGRGVAAYRNEGKGDLFLEACASLGGGWVFRNQKVWARFINPEMAKPQIINDGGQLWVMGFKFEAGSPGFVGLNGSQTEALGGLFNLPGGSNDPASALVINDNSRMSITGAEDGVGPTFFVREFENGAQRSLKRTEVWTPRGKGKDQINLALYRRDAARQNALDAPSVGIRVTDAIGSEDGDPVAFEVFRPDAALQPLTINLALHPHTAMGAKELSDLPQSVVIPAGQKAATITIHARDDKVPGAPRPLRLSVVGGAGYRVDPNNSASGKAILQDNEVNLSGDLQALYTFVNDSADASGKGNDATVEGAQLGGVGGVVAATFGDEKARIVLSPNLGHLSYREFSGAPGQSFMHAGFSSRGVAFWARSEAKAGARTLFAEGGDAGWNVKLVGDAITAVGSNNREDRVTIQAPWPTDGKWHHVALVYSSGDLTLYLNGAQVASGELEGGSVSSHKAGAQLGPAAGASLTDFVVYGRALNATEIKALAATAPGQLKLAASNKTATGVARDANQVADASKLDFEGEKAGADGTKLKGFWGAAKGKVEIAVEKGNQFLRFTNDQAGQSSQLHRRFDIAPDAKSLAISARIKTVNVVRGPKPPHFASILLTWEDANRKPLGYGFFGLDEKSSDWKTITDTFKVPDGARSVKLSLGLNQATGEAWIDDVEVKAASPR